MIGMLFFLHAVLGFAFVGRAVATTTTTVRFCKGVIDDTELYISDIRQENGFNEAEERFSDRVHGTIEMIFPARVVAEELSAGFEKAIGHNVCGDVLWKLSEWNDFWRWAHVSAYNSHSQEKIPVGRDGLWLIEVGRKRWADDEMRVAAFATGAKYKEIWVPLGMWPEQSSH